MRHEDRAGLDVYLQLDAIATGLPPEYLATFETDFTKHDREWCRRNDGAPFLWFVYGSGTHIVHGGPGLVLDRRTAQHARMILKTLREISPAVVRVAHCDGKTVRLLADDRELRQLLESFEDGRS